MKILLKEQKSRVVILIALIVVSLIEMIFRAVVMKEAALLTANVGEQVAVVAFASLVLFFTLKGNDKVSYISCGVLIAYFVLDQLFELPGIFVNLLVNIKEPIVAISIAIRLLTMNIL